MIHKHALSLLGFLAFLAWISVSAQPSNVVETSGTGVQPKAEKFSELGDPAPSLTVLEWIKGKPVKIRPGTNFYAIVFCTLSRANEMALTNLTALQRAYEDKGLVTVVISGEPSEQLRNFVQIRGGEIGFTVAADDLAQRTTTDYQNAFGQYRLPRAYVVGRDGNVLWLGHPLSDNLGEVVDQVASGRFNLEQTKKETRDRLQMEEYLALARQADTNAVKGGQIMLRVRANNAPALCDLAFQIGADPYIQNRDLALANTALDRAEQLGATNVSDIAVYRSILIFQAGQREAALAHARQALAGAKTDADKTEINACIRVMEAEMAKAKSSQTNNASGTNAPVAKPLTK